MKKYKRKHRRRKKKSILLTIITLIFIISFIFSLTKIVTWSIDNKNKDEVLKVIKKEIIVTKDKYKINFTSLKEKNNDIVAFIKVNGTSIEYPVVKSTDNEFYLNHSFDKSSNGAGWLFINYINELDGTDKNITIFGHSRKDGSMLGTLYKTLSKEWQEDEKNHKILFITENSYDKYEVFSTYKILNEDYYIKNDFKTDEEYKEFLDTLTKRSNYNYEIELTVSDSILTLSTCASNDKYRIVLHAKKIG